MSSIAEYLNSVSQCLNRKDSSGLLNLLTLDPTANHIPVLQKNLINITNRQLQEFISKENYLDNNWPSFDNYVLSYLIYVRDFNPWSILDSIDLMIKVSNDLSISLNNNTYNNNLLYLVQDTFDILIPLIKKIDTKLMIIDKRTNNYTRLSNLSTILLKSLNNLRSDLDLNLPSNKFKQSIVMYLSIKLCQIYNLIDSPMLCNNVFSNINNLNLNAKNLQKSQLIQYRFLVGKFHFLQSNFLNAFNHFNWCFNNLHSMTNSNIIITILKYLIPSGLLIGKVINFNNFGNFNTIILNNAANYLINLYKPLTIFYKNGDLFNFTKILFDNKNYFVKLGILSSFIQRIRILIFRNLMIKIYKINNNSLNINLITKTLILILNPNESKLNFKNEFLFYVFNIGNNEYLSNTYSENILINLIDNNLIKGKITASTKLISLSKTGTFPDIYTVYQTKYPLSSSEKWMDRS
ncbi:hypothetical protein BVG19_g2064 [[Candida] boidinii]|nr:hypothetical protein BVG19_g2064 [[Candida] boidinii]OWB48821.1 hypothetical protein B5S27_g358 [[Candida] boidinii]